MREIKFRAWDGDKLIGFGDLMCRQGHLDAFINTIAETTAANNPNGPKYNLMQYTGIKDKNGVDIYEGDIVAYETSQSTTKGVVEYGSGLYGWVHAGIWFHMWDMHLDSAEVIGNIYENPDLLKEEQ